jgi:hypothetical protein
MLFQIFIDIVLQNVRIMLRLEAESIDERPNAVKPRFALSVLRDRTGGAVIIAAVIASAAILFANFFMWVSSRE